jgi:hypothetical protein
MDWNVDPEVVRKVQETVWDNFYESGGWGMYPTTLFGFVLVLLACLYAFRPEPRYLAVVVATGFLTMAWGLSGMVTGLMHVFRYVQYVGPDDAVKVAALGCAESVTNVLFAVLLVIVAGLATLVGLVRRALRPASAA